MRRQFWHEEAASQHSFQFSYHVHCFCYFGRAAAGVGGPRRRLSTLCLAPEALAAPILDHFKT